MIDKQKKIPNSDDEMPDYIDDHEIWKNLTNANLLERLNIYKKCEIAIPREEYDYHYLSINQGNENFKLGTGYFKDINNLKEYLFRHAQFLDEPDLMPKQTEIPRRVSSYVQQHGGQYIVSQKIGLKYQGQLVNTDGSRVYWTDLRLLKLLDDVNIFSKQRVQMTN